MKKIVTWSHWANNNKDRLNIYEWLRRTSHDEGEINDDLEDMFYQSHLLFEDNEISILNAFDD